jgi:TolB-like protein/DNA-binding winged helix-turn-helix (wHTH) protein/Flp pilus assembly protein TadD
MSRWGFGLFEFDSVSGELRREGEIVRLQPQPAKVLRLLLEHPGELVAREQLKKHIWGNDTFVDFERGLNFCVLQVRTALRDVSDNPRFVQTVPRKGYRFIAPVTVVGEQPLHPAPAHAEPLEAARDGTRDSVVHSAKWRWILAATTLLVVAPVAGLVVLDRPPATPAASVPEQALRLAVLPFLNLTGDQTLEYVGDGLTDEVISQLSLLAGDHVAVIARTSAMSYRDSSKNVAQIGRELDVDYVVESSVRQQGDGLRVASRLIRVSDQTPEAAWSETFGPASSGDLQQTRAATRLARLVALQLMPGRVPDLAITPTVNDTAWNHFLKGKALLNSGAAADVREALVQFETAVTHDSTFAPALAKIAEVRHLLAMMGALAPRDAYAPARAAAEQAIAADMNLADAHLALGLVQLWHDWRPSDAARSFERALSLNPSLAPAHHDYAWSLLALGRTDDAVRHISTARALDPLSTRANNDVGWLYLQLRNPGEAARACEHTLAIEPSSLEAQACLERAHAQRALFDAALEAAKATIPPSSGFRPPEGAGAEAALRSIWRWRLDQLERASKTRWISPYSLAGLRVALGESEQAIHDLEAAYDDRAGMMVLLEKDPMMDLLRQNPRAQALIARIAGQADGH